MAYAQEMKNLVADIKTGHRDRTQYVKDVKAETARLMEGHGAWIKEMAKDLKDFLAKSEDTRKKDFTAMMGEIRAKVKDIKGDTADLLAQYDKEMKELAANLRNFLKKNEANRMTDFKGMMKDIAADIDSIRKAVGTLLADYKTERKEAAGYWAKLRGKEEVTAPAKKAAPAKAAPKVAKKKGGRKKK